MAYYAQFTHLLTYMEQTTPNEFGETLMELSAEAAATLAAETDEERAQRIEEEEERKQDFKALLLLNMEATKRISNTYRGRSSEIGEVMEAAVLKIRTAYFEAKAEAKAVAHEMALEQAQAKAEAQAQAKAEALAAV